MPTQRKRKNPTRRGNSPVRDNESGGRGEYRRQKPDNSLTTILIVCIALVAVVIVLIAFNSKSKPVPVQPAPNVVQQNPEPVTKPVEPEPEVAKPEVATKKKVKVAAPVEPKKKVEIEVSGQTKKEVVQEEEPVEKPAKPNSDDEVVIPKSFMGGLTNPDMEEKNKGKNVDKEGQREEAAKKKDLNVME
jgi:flagellar basal body-associated protein FliL